MGWWNIHPSDPDDLWQVHSGAHLEPWQIKEGLDRSRNSLDHRAVQELESKMDMVLTKHDEIDNRQDKVDRSRPLRHRDRSAHATSVHLACAHARAGAVGARQTGCDHGCPHRPRQPTGKGRGRQRIQPLTVYHGGMNSQEESNLRD
jgi:hypothetical protein